MAESVSEGFGVTSLVFLIISVYKALFPAKDRFFMPFILIAFKSHDKVGFCPMWCVNNSRISIQRFWGHIANISHQTGLQGTISLE